MERRFVDLHTHSSASDGSDSPSALVRRADERGLAAVALTDHDTLAGLEEAESASVGREIELVRGVEISARVSWGEAHLLGLWLPRDTARLAALEEALAEMRVLRDARNRRMMDNLIALGLPVTYEALVELAAEWGDGVIGRPHFAELLLRRNIVATRKEAFQRYLGSTGSAYVPRELMDPVRAVRLMADTGAIVALAHPCLTPCPQEDLEALITALKPVGLTALEAYHSEHGAAAERFCVGLAERYGLLLTGGSDYHGTAKPGVELGRGKGGLRVSRHVWEKLKNSRDRLDWQVRTGGTQVSPSP